MLCTLFNMLFKMFSFASQCPRQSQSCNSDNICWKMQKCFHSGLMPRTRHVNNVRNWTGQGTLGFPMRIRQSVLWNEVMLMTSGHTNSYSSFIMSGSMPSIMFSHSFPQFGCRANCFVALEKIAQVFVMDVSSQCVRALISKKSVHL